VLEWKVGYGFVVGKTPSACEGVGGVHFWRLWTDYLLLRANVRELACVCELGPFRLMLERLCCCFLRKYCCCCDDEIRDDDQMIVWGCDGCYY